MPTRPVRAGAALALLLLVSACASPAGGGPSPEPAPAAADATVVLQVTEQGGYTTPALLTGRIPTVTVYADGRLITDGPVVAIWPAPALPNLQLYLLDDGGVRDLVDRALAAGVAETDDLGRPPVTDVTTTRFVVRTGGTTVTREAYALGMDLGPAPAGEAGLTEEQAAARDRLLTFLDELRDPAAALGAERVTGPEPYRPEAVAALVSPYVEVEPAQPEQRWPGPELPGEPIAPGVTCATATGAEAQALLEAAESASAATPWTSADGSRWTVLLRPLLPHESGCADLPPA
ncbi:hypothetical protein GCU60_11380 [Blastococcus saxobsidens]|uniref:Lipoprotein n=1 Tax=Blastococcus saxobsidens TaxID=138336 RepID=A0A6L9W2S2_9ACTN|nr:hypothetical protein [Blastococcus saxobsidens]NEK86355.1 hypothetical protein [Blastococcus saxobsidens]